MLTLWGVPDILLKEVHYFVKFEKPLFDNFPLLDICYF